MLFRSVGIVDDFLARLSEGEQEAIRGGNAVRVYGLDTE